MTDYMLRTNTEAQMDAALTAAGLLSEQPEKDGSTALVPTAGVNLDRIGPIPPKYDADGDPVPGTGDARYHANLRMTVELTEAQIALLPTFDPEPQVPYRVWA
jgi:hypothetical protein